MRVTRSKVGQQAAARLSGKTTTPRPPTRPSRSLARSLCRHILLPTFIEPQNLFTNGFSRDGYDFAGWTTTSSWEGTPYADGESVKDLATENGAVVTLYAQWEPHAYYVHFDPNGANTVDAGVLLDQ